MYGRIRVNTLSGYENVLDIYELDRYGNVYGKNGIELSKRFNTTGYLQVSLKVKQERRWKKCFVHRLVALAFVDGRTEELNEVDHIDTVKTNNNYYNLRWCNRKMNMNNEITKDKISAQKSNVCYVYDFRLNYIGCYRNIGCATRELGVYVKYINTKVNRFYVLSENDLSLILKINRKTRSRSVVITNILNGEKHYFYCNKEAARFFDGKVNISDAIKYDWTVRGKYKVRNLNYKKLIGMLDL